MRGREGVRGHEDMICTCNTRNACVHAHVHATRVRGVGVRCEEHLPLEPLSPHADGQLREEGLGLGFGFRSGLGLGLEP